MRKIVTKQDVERLADEFSDLIKGYEFIKRGKKTNPEQGTKIKFRLKDGTWMEAYERINKSDIKYNYHWRRRDNSLIIRWDKADNHPEVSTSPYHTHIEGISGAQPSEPMTLKKVLAYIAATLGVFLVVWVAMYTLASQ